MVGYVLFGEVYFRSGRWCHSSLTSSRQPRDPRDMKQCHLVCPCRDSLVVALFSICKRHTHEGVQLPLRVMEMSNLFDSDLNTRLL